VTFTDQAGNRRYIKRRADNKTQAKEFVKQILRDLDDTVTSSLIGDPLIDSAKNSRPSAKSCTLQISRKIRSRV
jgi:hypothetical protein